MKLKKTLITSALLFTGVAMFVTDSHAATISANIDDIIISFRTKDNSITNNLEVDLGNWANPISTIDLSADLVSVYGASWNTNTQLVWSVVGTTYNNPPGSEQSYTIYYTAPTSPTLAIVTQPGTSGAQTQAAGSINTLTAFLNGKTSFSSLGNDFVDPTSQAASYTKMEQNGSVTKPFNFFANSGRLENGVASSGSNSSAFYKLVPTDEGGSGAVSLGSFSLGSNGTLSFTQAIPEPSTYALVGLGALALLKFRPRKFNVGLPA